MGSCCVLFCTLCKTGFGTQTEWLRHLLSSSHQTLTRGECHRWDESVKECVFVVFASFPVASTPQLVRFFSKIIKGNLVTDFLWDPKRVRVRFIRFESRSKVDALFNQVGNHAKIDEGLEVEFKRANEYLSNEWNVYLPDPDVKQEGDEEEEEHTKTSIHEDDNDKTTCGGERKRKRIATFAATTAAQNPISPSPSSSSSQAAATANTESQLKLWKKYVALCDFVKIPNNTLLNLDRLKFAIKNVFKKDFPKMTVAPFRSWCLGIRNATSNELLILVDLAGGNGKSFKVDTTPLPEQEELERTLLAGQRNRFAIYEEDGGGRGRKCYIFKKSDIQFSVGFDGWHLLEARTGSLLKYLLTFDWRAKPLLNLLHFWASSNQIQLAEDGLIEPTEEYKALPDPAALEWLLIFYLSWAKVIPPPKEFIGGRNRPRIIVVEGLQVDTDINGAPKLARKWKNSILAIPQQNTDEFVLSILKLTRDFFEFCTGSNLQGCILSTSQATIIRNAAVDDVLIPNEVFGSFTPNRKERKEILGRLHRGEVLMLQPFVPKYRFSISSQRFTRACSVMEATVIKINSFLENFEVDQDSAGFGSIFKTAM